MRRIFLFFFFLAEFKRERNYEVDETYRSFINTKQLTFLEKANECLCGSPRWEGNCTPFRSRYFIGRGRK